MSLHTIIGKALAKSLVHLRKKQAALEHDRDVSSASYTKRMYQDNLDNTDDAQARMITTMTGYLEGTARGEDEGEYAAILTQLQSSDALYGVFNEQLALSDEDKSAGPIDYTYNNSSGAIMLAKKRGWLAALGRQMTTDAKTLLQCTTTFGALTAGSGNVGSLASAGPIGYDHCFTGTLVFVVSSQSVSTPTLTLSNTFTKPLASDPIRGKGDKFGFIADNPLTSDKAFVDWQIGVSLTITRPGLTAPTESGDAGNVLSAYTVTTPKDADCDTGIFYFLITRQTNAPIWLVELYKDASHTTRVGATTTDTVAGSVALTINCNGGTTVAFTFNRVNANVAMAAAGNSQSSTIDILTPRLGDRWTMTITNDEAGVYATKLKQAWQFSLPSGVAASADYAEALAASVSMT